ncbi:hypothetical protein WDZ92_04760 [Nostoc sp. NIES-2111]
MPQEMAFRSLEEPSFEFCGALLNEMRRGNVNATVAARYLGVPETTFTQWLAIGKSDAETQARSNFAYLHVLADAGDAGIEISLISKIAASRDWRALAWLAEKRWPLRFDSALLRLKGIERHHIADNAPAWVEPILTIEEEVETLIEFENLVIQGSLLLAAIPQHPENVDDKTPGIRSIVAEALRLDLENGRVLSDEVARQVVDFFKENPSVAATPNETAPIM